MQALRSRILSTENLLRPEVFPTDVLQKHNAFPDAVYFQNREYLVFRSAKQHAPHNTSVILITSRPSGTGRFTVEKTIRGIGYDVRDPRLVIFQNTLHIYFAAVNKSIRKVKLETMHVVRGKDGRWSTSKQIYKQGYLPSRVKKIGNKLYMTVYEEWSARRLAHLRCRVIVSQDGLTWSEKTKFGTLVHEGTESDWLPIGTKTFLWVIRNDFGREEPSGSNIYLIDVKGRVLRTRNTPVKYDAPLIIVKGTGVYIVSRFQKRFKGRYRLASVRFPHIMQDLVNVSAYQMTSKTTILSRLLTKTLEIQPLLSLETCGDTGYCAFAQHDHKTFIYTYSSDFSRQKMSWIRAQRRATSIYRFEVKLA